MCTYNITINDYLVERARPAIGADTDIGQWMQRQMETLLIRLAANSHLEVKQYDPDLETIHSIPKLDEAEVPEIVCSLLGAGSPVDDQDLNAREAFYQYQMEKHQ